MLSRYENYLKASDSLTFEEFNKIYSDLVAASSNINDSDFKEYWQEMLLNAFIYANRRSHWSIQTSVERREIDERRIREHNAFMASLKLIFAYLNQEKQDTSWFDQIGTIDRDRKRFGDFACFISFIHGLNMR